MGTGRRAATWLAGLLAAPAGLTAISAFTQAAVADDFLPTAGAYVVDTTTLTISGPGGTVDGVEQEGVAVFAFDSVSVPAGVSMRVLGARPFRLEASGGLSVGGVINADGFGANDFSNAPVAGGPGGGAGGAPGAAGAGTGGGMPPADQNHGAGGGSFGGTGARGGPAGSSGIPGPAYGPLHLGLHGGSGGGGTTVSGNTSGGGGGGAVSLVGSDVVVASGAVVSADGGGGAAGGFGATGGGSGGAIVLQGDEVEVAGVLRARGGPGGAGGCCGAGGGGGGGRIALRYADSLSVTGTTSVAGGQSGFRTTTGCCLAGPIGDAFGATGVLTSVHATSLAGSPSRSISYGRSTTVGTTLRDQVSEQALAGQQLDLYSRLLPDGEWVLLDTFATAGSGGAGRAVSPKQNTEYQWRFAGSDVLSAAVSPAQRVSVAPVVGLRTTAARPRTGARFTLWGTVQPTGAGEEVRLQRKAGAGWKTLASTTLKKQRLPGGKKVGYSFVRKATKGSSVFRVLKPPTATLVQGTSPRVTVKGS